MSSSKEPFRFIRKWATQETDSLTGEAETRTHCEYEASFWEGPIEAGQLGRYRRRVCQDTIIKGRFLNTAPNVSYYDQLKKSCAR